MSHATTNTAIAVRTHNLAVGYTKQGTAHSILEQLNLSIPKGKMTAIVGINGAGKSTLLRALAGITQPLAGTVELHAAPRKAQPAWVAANALSPKQRAQHITMIGQEEHIPSDLSVQEFVALGRLPYIKPWQMGSKTDFQIVAQAIATVGLEEYLHASCDAMSGGQRKRALLARGLAQETPILMLDEPTNHLDVHQQLHILEVLAHSGKTVIATVHDLDLAVSRFDHVIVLHNKQVCAQGPPQTVLIPETIAEVFRVHASLVQTQYHAPAAQHLVFEEVVVHEAASQESE